MTCFLRLRQHCFACETSLIMAPTRNRVVVGNRRVPREKKERINSADLVRAADDRSKKSPRGGGGGDIFLALARKTSIPSGRKKRDRTLHADVSIVLLPASRTTRDYARASGKAIFYAAASRRARFIPDLQELCARSKSITHVPGVNLGSNFRGSVYVFFLTAKLYRNTAKEIFPCSRILGLGFFSDSGTAIS